MAATHHTKYSPTPVIKITHEIRKQVELVTRQFSLVDWDILIAQKKMY